ncbi:MAG: hypothetical protein AB1390_07500 [Nitrospirota bacterium]
MKAGKEKRRTRRFKKRLLARIDSGTFICGGITGDVSNNGIFMRGVLLPDNVMLTIQLYLLDNKISSLKGVVRRNVKIPGSNWLFGTGIELKEKDYAFQKFLRTLT